jgi:8-amino-3,8-dideoxy-alpha-D-manno-octulosonate transaminase
MRTAARLPVEQTAHQDYANLHLPQSQEVIGRLISFGIRCTWSEDDVRKLAGQIATAVQKAMMAVPA